ncbi:MAG: peptidyl-dipeptidase [Sorangium cellulosum]|nr:MAG: peptidyl-dipeptidase [Sorangium cellulosum]
MKFRHAVASVGWVMMMNGCGAGAPQTAPLPPLVPPAEKPAPVTTPEQKLTADQATAFLAQVDADLRQLYLQRDRAAWVNMTYINEDTDALATASEEATMAYFSEKIREAQAFEGVEMPPEAARQMLLLRLQSAAPAPSDPAKRAELAGILTWMSSAYGSGKYCTKDAKGEKSCQSLHELTSTMAKSRNYDELKDTWTGWRTISPPMRPKYERFVTLANEGAREIGYADLGALWRSGYDMLPEQFEQEVERLWAQVKPLYEELHCYVRTRLQKKYGKDKVADGKAIPAHLLGNMWAQEWGHIHELTTPYPGLPSLDVGKELVRKKVGATAMVKQAETFFTSLGFQPLPQTFWARSLFVKPQDREVVCHASAWDVGSRNDLRIKMCIKPTEEDLVTIHHELGHIFYYQEYYKLPILYQNGANDGFHEGIGDAIALSVTPEYLAKVGLLRRVQNNDRARMNQMMRMAMDKIAFLPFGLIVDKWRWDVFAGKTSPADYNKAWWALRTKYQGIEPPVGRSEKDFDPGAKYHIPGNTPYMRYFLARILQFQFHRALCRAAGHDGPLDQCSIFDSKEAGSKLRAMLQLGASKPWPEALKMLGEDRMDAQAMIDYFTPLRKYLQEQNKGKTCGW